MAEIGTTPNRVHFASAGAVRRCFPSPADELAPLPPARSRSQLSEIERAHHRCVAELMVLRPRGIIGIADRFDLLNRTDYLDDFLGAVESYVRTVVADTAKEFPLGFTDDDTDILIRRMKDVVRALKEVVDRTIEGEAA